jgi:hypothetical protein
MLKCVGFSTATTAVQGGKLLNCQLLTRKKMMARQDRIKKRRWSSRTLAAQVKPVVMFLDGRGFSAEGNLGLVLIDN